MAVSMRVSLRNVLYATDFSPYSNAALSSSPTLASQTIVAQPVRDAHGYKCAGVGIKSLLRGVDFDSTPVVDLSAA
jgi:hypothetical protein